VTRPEDAAKVESLVNKGMQKKNKNKKGYLVGTPFMLADYAVDSCDAGGTLTSNCFVITMSLLN